MRTDLVTLCDAAVEINGRLQVLGTIDFFWTASLPYVHPRCALAFRLRWDGYERARKHKIRVQVLDSDGYSIATEFEAKLAPPPAKHDDVPLVRHVIVGMESLRFESYGPYAIRIEADGKELASLPFSVVPVGCLSKQRTAQ